MEYKVITVNPENVSPFNGGKFQGWGSSFCWWANRVGYNKTLCDEMARLFYSKEEGLGLNIVRYNIGGGDDPSHVHIKRTDSAMPGYWKAGSEGYEDGKYVWEYDWSRDENQRNALAACMKKYGEGMIVEAFSNSPPYFMTQSGCTGGSVNPVENNLKRDAYAAFAKYMADVALHFKEEWGIRFQSITPLNEPQLACWNAFSFKQEGCHFEQGESQSRIIVELEKAMCANGFEDMIYCASDETDIDIQIKSYNMLSPGAKSVVGRIDTHTYSGTGYYGLKKLAQDAGMNLWMSEVDGGVTAGTNAGEMGAALFFAEKVVTDINGLTPSAWIMWQLVDNHVCKAGLNGIRDSGMVDPMGGYWGVAVADHDKEKIILTKKYYAYGQFTRYIRPGFTIIACSDNAAAAVDKNTGELVIVAVNTEDKDTVRHFDLSGFESVGKNVRIIRTSGDMETGENWAELEPVETIGKSFRAVMKAYSVTTYILDGVCVG